HRLIPCQPLFLSLLFVLVFLLPDVGVRSRKGIGSSSAGSVRESTVLQSALTQQAGCDVGTPGTREDEFDSSEDAVSLQGLCQRERCVLSIRIPAREEVHSLGEPAVDARAAHEGMGGALDELGLVARVRTSQVRSETTAEAGG